MAKVRAFRTMENAIRRMGFLYVAGVDEVGRGCLAGPVVAAAVVLNPDRYVPRISDSKTVTALERDKLYDQITRNAVTWGVASASCGEIDTINIHQASLRAMQRAVQLLAPSPDFVLVDAFRIPGLLMAQRAVIHGDSRCTAIAAASIVAKVTRDRLMGCLGAAHPGYGFERHMGYSVPEHFAALNRLGPCVHHRRKFAPVAALLGVTDPAEVDETAELSF